MKKRLILSIISVVLLLVVLCACAKPETEDNLWQNAIYTDDTAFGNGEKEVTVTVKVNENSVKFTIKTDSEFLGDALTEHKLIEGEEGAYGLYIKKVNGITADYDTDKSYWSLTKDGEYMTTGADGAEIKDGEKYEITYVKE